MIWCRDERCYYCIRCYEAICKPVHGDKPALRKAYRTLGIGVLAVSVSALVPFAAILILTPTAWTGLEDSVTAGYLLLLPLFAGGGWLVLSAGIRRFWSTRSLAGHQPIPPNSFAETQDPKFTWRPNRTVFPRRLAVLYSIVGIAAAIDIALTLLVIPSSPPVILRFAEIIVIFATIIGGTAAILAALPFAVPTAVAVAEDGVHFWYQSVYDRRTSRDPITWLDLNLMAMTFPGSPDVVRGLARHLRIDPENATFVASEWSMHRIDRSGPSARPSPTGRSEMFPTPPATRRSQATVEGTVTTTGHGPMCARCFVRFPWVEGLRLFWCKVDRFYVCRRCWRDGCKDGHGRGKWNVSKPARIMSGIVIALAILAVLYPAVSYDHVLTSAWHDAPVVGVSGLRVGELAKVAGTIRSNQRVAWGGHEIYSQEGGWWWNWNTTDSFTLSDGTGTIDVTPRAFYVGYVGLHLASYATHTEMWVYESGDTVQIVGTVIRSATGAPLLEAKIMAEQVAVALISLAPSQLVGLLLYLIPAIMVGLVAGGGALFLSRRLRTGTAIATHPIFSLGAAGEARDRDLTWLPNGRGTTPRRRVLWAGGSGLVSVGGLLAFPGVMPRPEFGYSTLGWVGTIVIMIEAAFAYTVLFAGWGRPSFVAAAEDGFHMWFESPYDRHLNDTLFLWADIGDIHMTGGEATHWVLQWKTGEKTNLYMLKGANLQVLLVEWAKRRMASL
jgi:hypothetical protein